MDTLSEIPVLRLGLAQGLAHWAIYRREMPALVVDGKTQTYAEIDGRAADVHRRLSERIAPGDRVGVVVEAKDGLLSAVVGVVRAGGTAVLCVPSWSEKQLGSVVAANDINVIVSDADRSAVRRDNGSSIEVVSVLTSQQAGMAPPTSSARLANSIWAVLFSSGTSGTPKGIVRTDLSILNELVCWCLELSICRTTTFYVGRPLYYTGGLMLSAATLMAGGQVIAPSQHSAEDFERLCFDSPPTYAFLLPSQIQDLVDSAKGRAVHSLGTTILSMGAFIEPDLKEQVLRRLGCQFIESWGNSEGLGTITSPEDASMRPDSIGRPFIGDTLLITTDGGAPLAVGEQGRLSGRADSCLSSYLGLDELTRCLIKEDLVISEDIARRDPGGYFYLVGRVSDLVTRGDAVVNLREIDRAALRLEGVCESCVIATPGSAAEPLIVVAVVLGKSMNLGENEIANALNAALPASHRVDRVCILPGLPKNAAGKVMIDEVRKTVELHLRHDGARPPIDASSS